MKLSQVAPHTQQYYDQLIKIVQKNLQHLLDNLDINIEMFSKYKDPSSQVRLARMKDAREEILQISQGNIPPGGPSSEVMQKLYGLSMTDRDTYGT
jgi:hypothetical protein